MGKRKVGGPVVYFGLYFWPGDDEAIDTYYEALTLMGFDFEEHAEVYEIMLAADHEGYSFIAPLEVAKEVARLLRERGQRDMWEPWYKEDFEEPYVVKCVSKRGVKAVTWE